MKTIKTEKENKSQQKLFRKVIVREMKIFIKKVYVDDLLEKRHFNMFFM